MSTEAFENNKRGRFFSEVPRLTAFRNRPSNTLYRFEESDRYIVRKISVDFLTQRVLPWQHISIEHSIQKIEGFFRELEDYGIKTPITEFKLDPDTENKQNFYVITNNIEGEELEGMLREAEQATKERIRLKVEELLISLAKYIHDKYMKSLELGEEQFYLGDIFDSAQYMVTLEKNSEGAVVYLVDTDPDFFTTEDMDSLDDCINDFITEIHRLENVFDVQFTRALAIMTDLVRSLPEGHRIWAELE